MACEHGEAGTHRRHHAAADAPWDDPLMLPLASPQFAAETRLVCIGPRPASALRP